MSERRPRLDKRATSRADVVNKGFVNRASKLTKQCLIWSSSDNAWCPIPTTHAIFPLAGIALPQVQRSLKQRLQIKLQVEAAGLLHRCLHALDDASCRAFSITMVLSIGPAVRRATLRAIGDLTSTQSIRYQNLSIEWQRSRNRMRNRPP